MATLRNLGIAILKPGGHASIAAACRYHARNATGVLASSASPQHDQNGHNITVPRRWSALLSQLPSGPASPARCPETQGSAPVGD
jgi:hypothetical protein